MAINFDEAAAWLAANLDLVELQAPQVHQRHGRLPLVTLRHKQVDFLFDLYDQAKAREANAEG